MAGVDKLQDDGLHVFVEFEVDGWGGGSFVWWVGVELLGPSMCSLLGLEQGA